ncbi:MAG: activator of (R)-2-hydroxyglutaryl-CoA dehydratase [Candidatus Eisenbacteria bacterium]
MTNSTLSPTEEKRIERQLGEVWRRWEQEAGLAKERPRPYSKPKERPFTAKERAHTTLLFGGLTWKHEKLLQAAFESLGYKCAYLPPPDVRAFQLGKEYGNNGQCNPTYFTVGNLVQYLQGLEQGGMNRTAISNDYIYLTAGACGPCRFGMYEAEYRLALRNAGFEEFRVILFQQSGGLDQADVEDGLAMNLDFFLGILNAFNMGDLVNEVAYRIRPYETNPGETDRALRDVIEDLYETIQAKKRFELEGRWGGAAARVPGLASKAAYVGKFLDQLTGDEFVKAMSRARERFDRVDVDRLRVKPLVKITGEFWAQTTEGDGNFNMFAFLERENAQVLVEPIGTWITYMIHGAMNKIRDRKGLEEGMVVPGWREPWKRTKIEWRARKKLRRLAFARTLFHREYNRLRTALGGTAHALADQLELERMGHPFYNSRAGGGEGHLEVAKNIYYHHKDLAHMVLSLKPFGCMPSTQSDGAQAAVVSHYPDMIYLPIETSGEGEINAHSRVQMALGEARTKARDEFERALAKGGYPLPQIRAYADVHAELKRPMYPLPHTKGYSGEAANFALHVAARMRKEGVRREGTAPSALPAADPSLPVREKRGKGVAA